MLALRKAEKDDLEAKAKLHTLSWKTAYRGIVPDEPLDSRKWESALEGWKSTYESYPDNLSIHVAPNFHRQGIGSLIIADVFDRTALLGFGSAIVWTLESLVQPRRFYEKCGGVVVKTGVWSLGNHNQNEAAYGWERLPDLS